MVHTEPFTVPKRFPSNIRATLTKHISTSNSFELLSENSENVLEANHVLSPEINNTVKDNKSNNANTSSKNRKSASKNKRNKNDQNKIVTAMVCDSVIKDVYIRLGIILQRGEDGCETFQWINDRRYEDLHPVFTQK